MNKREERDHKFKLLFSAQFYPDGEIPEQLAHYFESPDYEDGDRLIRIEALSEEEERSLRTEVGKIVERLPELDRELDRAAEGWTTKRMSRTDLTVLRLALYELHYDEGVPEKVALNEAVEIAKKYGGAESGSFVNGVLARIVSPREDTAAEKTPRSRKGELTEMRQGGKKMHVLVNKKE
ncbi:transcription antitermination factor NusB [Oribacterium sp. oral taxon 102]|uniref:transcription antitermination factor NusB n=1 Tax=Oribacterium sp. oral taxon 102 TaxID=671214 RepID=UPI0015BA6E3A|nr:transcription antitermination factor NusB [Oribacterium sp. oral taxon 102]NWO21261.1 transcription antitermination factor NusB [Oribacterium sp. oral taxon 102]